MKKSGNEYLLELFENNEQKLLNYIFNSSFFLSKEATEKYENENNAIRNSQSHKLYQFVNGNYSLIKNTKNLKKRLKEYSIKDNLFLKENEGYVSVKIDSTGNAAPRKFLVESMGINLLNSNYKISHLEKKANTPVKHGFKNIIITPTFLDHFIDQNIKLDGKSVTNIAKLLSCKINGMEASFFNDFNPNSEERKFIENLNLNIL